MLLLVSLKELVVVFVKLDAVKGVEGQLAA